MQLFWLLREQHKCAAETYVSWFIVAHSVAKYESAVSRFSHIRIIIENTSIAIRVDCYERFSALSVEKTEWSRTMAISVHFDRLTSYVMAQAHH